MTTKVDERIIAFGLFVVVVLIFAACFGNPSTR
jgi:hypothetical protein